MTKMKSNDKFLGILQINTTFYRPVGDVANKKSWEMPVKIKIVKKSNVDTVVRTSRNYSREFIEIWIKAAQELEQEGAVAIITSCGFLALLQSEIQSKISIPIATTSLLQIPFVQRLIPSTNRVGIITFDAQSLEVTHLNEVGADVDTPIVGIQPNCAFRRWINCEGDYSFEELKSDMVEAATRLMQIYPAVGAIVLECANMHPFKDIVQETTQVPVWDIISLGKYIYYGVS